MTLAMNTPDRFESWRPFVWVFIPYYVRETGIESPEYDLPAFRAEVKSWFDRLGYEYAWTPVTIANHTSVIDSLMPAHREGRCAVLNLCDGSELDGSPGITVVRALESANIPFTGGSPFFFEITTHKVPLKARLLEHGVATSPYVPLRTFPEDLRRIETELGYPAFIKPEVSSGSSGISIKSRVTNAQDVMDRIATLLGGEDGEFYRTSGIYAERFIDGPEFTVFVVSDKSAPIGARAYPPVQRLFHSDLPAHERFLSFDRYWSEFKEESRLSPGQPFYRYGMAPERLAGRLADLAERAYVALEGRSYGRVDIRLDEKADELFVLEVNANCGLSGDSETSVGEMLLLSKIPVTQVITGMLRDALDRAVANGYALPGRQDS